jgi:hypothetical protein
MNLNEIFNTKPPISWSTTDRRAIGVFELEGIQYHLILEEYTVKLSKNYSFVDFAFTANNEFALTGIGKSAKVFGAIQNGAIPKLKSMNPDAILFGVHNVNSAVSDRKSLYERLAYWYARGSVYQKLSPWLDLMALICISQRLHLQKKI